MENLHCRHILFCGSADGGYSRLLTPFVTDEVGSKRITLVKGPPFARDLADLAQSFATTSFPTLFRTTNILPSRGNSFAVTSPAAPIENYASVAASAPKGVRPELNKTSQLRVLRNSQGQRVDAVLRFAQNDLQGLKNSSLCHQYHLMGSCSYGNVCVHMHGAKLVGKSLDALRFLTRLSPCSSGTRCDDPMCIYGHCCPRWPCHNRGSCRFSSEMHGIDTVVV